MPHNYTDDKFLLDLWLEQLTGQSSDEHQELQEMFLAAAPEGFNPAKMQNNGNSADIALQFTKLH